MFSLTAIKVRMYPTKIQKEQLEKTFGCCRFLWNQMLNEHQLKYKQYKIDGIKVPYKTEVEYKKIYPFLSEVDSIALQSSRENLNDAYIRFFKNIRDRKAKKTKQYIGYPNFKSRKDRQSFTTKMINDNIQIDFLKKIIKIPKLKTPIKYHDSRTFTEKIHKITISKTKSGEYYASILITRENMSNPLTEIHKDKIVAFDMSMKDFMVTGNYKLNSPRFFRKVLHKVKKFHRHVSRTMKKSKNRAKACYRLSVVYGHYVNQKKDWMHKITKKLADNNEVVILEDLNIEGMKRFNKGCAKSVTKDFSWGEFTIVLKYKMERQCKYLIKVDRFFPSSQLCSNCGYQYKDLTLDQREWDCPLCKVHHDRDINASQNLQKEGIRLLNEMGIKITNTTVGTTGSYAWEDCVRPHINIVEAVVNEPRIPRL